MVIYPYEEKMAEEWDTFVFQSSFGTILHTRRFLSYHQDRFRDCSLVMRDDSGRIQAVFPCAISPSDNAIVISHPGATYGGIVTSEQCGGETVVFLLQDICKHFFREGFEFLLYKTVPYIYHKRPAQDDSYAIFRAGGERYRCDLTSTIDLQNRGRISSRRKRGFKRSDKLNVSVASGVECAAQIWDVLTINLLKHGAKPVHSLSEILVLQSRFPKEIEFVGAFHEGSLVAGVVLFHSVTVTHAQYIASNNDGYKINALDFLFEHCIESALKQGKRYFDFGISNEKEGLKVNNGLFRFKSEFGSGSCVHEFFKINLLIQVNGHL